MNLNLNESVKKIYLLLIISILTVIIFVLSFVCYTNSAAQNRRFLFLFETIGDVEGKSSSVVLETRYIRIQPDVESSVKLYIADLLLGPITERCRKLFPPKTDVSSCFIRGSSLYLDLSKDALYTDEQTMEIENGVYLLKKNIFANFPSITNVIVFIDGKIAFEELEQTA